MSIVESTKAKSHHRFPRMSGLAGAALLSAAVFATSPKPVHAQLNMIGTGGTSTDPNSANAVSWFNTMNWNTPGTGTLPESQTTTPAAQNITANNTSMPSVGVVFDPADDSKAPGFPNANYVANLANIQGSFYVTSENGTVFAPSKLTVESGTIIVVTASIGRDGQGQMVMNGGTFITEGSLKIQGSNRTTLIGTGTLEYHGGNLESEGGFQLGGGACSSGVAKTSSGVGTFVVYNDGPDGAIVSANGFVFSANTNQMGTVGIVEFHYDLNSGLVANTRPIQSNWSNAGEYSSGGILHIQNGT